MDRRNVGATRVAIGTIACAVAATALVAAQKAPPVVGPPAKSAQPVKELVTLLESRKITAYAVKDPSEDKRFIAVLHIPGTQLLVVSATYDRPTDIEYFIYEKDFMRAYVDLNGSILSKGKIFVEDLVCDGLKALPAKGEAADGFITSDGKHLAFDGDFADPKRRNQNNKISQEEYLKAYTAADEAYAKLLTSLIEGLKKPAQQ